MNSTVNPQDIPIAQSGSDAGQRPIDSVVNRRDVFAQYCLLIALFCVPISTSAMMIALLVAVGLFLLSSQWQAKWAFFKSRPAFWMPYILFAVILISTLHGVVPWSTRFMMAKKYHALLLIPFLAWLFQRDLIKQKALALFLIAMSGIWILSYLLYYGGIEVIPTGRASIFHDHISIGTLSAFSIFVFLRLAYDAKQRGMRYGYLAMSLIGTWYMLFINSGRTAYIVFFVLMVMFAFQLWRWRGVMWGSIAAVGLACIAFFSSSVLHGVTVSALKDARQYQEHHIVAPATEDCSASRRLVSIKASVDLLKQHPLLGVGTGSFYEAAARLPWMTPDINTQPVSSEWLNISVQVGGMGMILLLLLYIVQWRQSL